MTHKIEPAQRCASPTKNHYSLYTPLKEGYQAKNLYSLYTPLKEGYQAIPYTHLLKKVIKLTTLITHLLT